MNLKTHWLILWWGMDEWCQFEGTEAEARDCATCDRRHHNYGRTGYSLISLSAPLRNEDPKASGVSS